ncbi:MAG: CapA family protein, partial [Candidatus Cloacimonetes bacterium]|nr:CapA family protein [Candidatus Cloacimonadota bacterium]
MKADADAMILRKTDLGWRYEMEKVDKPIRLIFAGDLCPDARNQELSSDHYKSFYQPFHDILHDKDYSVVNLECPLTNHPAPLAKVGPVLQAERRMIDLIKTGGFDAVCLANNHIMDQGAGGLEDTLTVCKESMISTVGAESDYNRARQILVKNINDVRIAFYNVCEQEFSISGLDRPGANPFDPVDCFHDIRKALQEVDLVIVIYHGGIEQANLPGPGLVKVFHYFAELGAAAVIGHHSHYPGGFELYRGVPLFYSLGNFILDRQDQKRDWY